MSNYIPHHTKKQKNLARKKHDLKRLVASGAHPEKLAFCAQAVPESRVRALKARRAQLAPSAVFDSQRREIDERLESLLNTSTGEILAEFGHSPDPACSNTDS